MIRVIPTHVKMEGHVTVLDQDTFANVLWFVLVPIMMSANIVNFLTVSINHPNNNKYVK